MLRGDEIWCQLFSEPGAGSDLASLATRAEPDGTGGWVVNGQKVWTSGAHHSDLAILLARTDPTVPKHNGITYFMLDMSTPGVEVRPLPQINRVAHFNEVFLTDVVIPPENVIGEVGAGWTVARTTLANERTMIGGAGTGAPFSELIDLARRTGRADDALVRQALASTFIRTEILRYLGLRVRTAVSHGQMPGPESSVMKLAFSRHSAITGSVITGILGAAGTLQGDPAPDDDYWAQRFLGQWSVQIGGGTDQIQRNVIGERVLGLEAEPRVDRGVAFRDIGRSG
jgi:alkylation response protein AidB-like acyl-CoA dehydrogenase